MAELMMRYGQFQYSHTFRKNDNIATLREGEDVAPAYGAAFDAEDGVKRHAACDECRKRKLKCSGDPTGCSRCIKQNLVCHYSEQKQMGRPRKKQKTDNDVEVEQIIPPEVVAEAKQRRLRQVIDPEDQMAYQGLCPGPWTQYLKNYTPPPKQPFMTTGTLHEEQSGSLGGSPDTTPPLNTPPTPLINNIPDIAYPTDVALWPDYSTMLELPQVVQDNHEKYPQHDHEHSHLHSHSVSSASPESLTALPATPACPCLPNLYLTLSTLSTLASFPVSSHSITTLQTAQKTAYSVLHCGVCPQRFQTGLQNVMLLGTLLTVLADGWHRVRKSSNEDLRRGFTPTRSQSQPPIDSSLIPLNKRQELEWQTFAYNLLRCNVFGDLPSATPPCPGASPLPSPSASTALLLVIEGMCRRQSQWHSPETATGEFPERLKCTEADGHLTGMSLKEIDAMNEAKDPRSMYFCMTLAERAKSAVKALDSPLPKWGG